MRDSWSCWWLKSRVWGHPGRVALVLDRDWAVEWEQHRAACRASPSAPDSQPCCPEMLCCLQPPPPPLTSSLPRAGTAASRLQLCALHLRWHSPSWLALSAVWHPLAHAVTPWLLPTLEPQQNAHTSAGTTKAAQSCHSSLDKVVFLKRKAVVITLTSCSVFLVEEPVLKPFSAVGAELSLPPASSQHSVLSQTLCPAGEKSQLKAGMV